MNLLVYLAIFFVVFLLTGTLGMCEPLRKIQGTAYPFLWLLFLAVLLVVTYLVLAKRGERHRERLNTFIQELTITHTEIPHLIKPIYPMVNNGYYLLRLYLQGIIRFSSVQEMDEDGSVMHKSQLTLDEARLETIKAQGGRHSTAAISMVRYIRDHAGCSISQVLAAALLSSMEEDETHQKIAQMQEHAEQVTGIVLAAVLGLAWGLLLAKYNLGTMYHKNTGYLQFMLAVGVPAVPALWSWLLTGVHGEDNTIIASAIRGKHYERPYKISFDLIKKVNDTLPLELERNTILNSYFIDFNHLKALAIDTPEQTFMNSFAREYDKTLAAVEEAARKAAEAARSDSSGCSSCGSCSSCGGCSGCGGCGGCGD